ncbi:MAG TPA: ribonuclease HI family protein [Patescibacteria group bacterium]|nr:ribonuclease HI family protein [Patescibacteria group bacterium]
MQLTLHTDGGARGNPGPAGIGVVIENSGLVVARRKAYIGEATNNVAEYRALILALQEALALGGSELDVVMDSELVVRQMNGQYKIKQPALAALAGEVLRLKNNFTRVSFRHVRREFNKEADALVNQAIDEALAKQGGKNTQA